MKQVIIVTGPGGAGKTTIAEMMEMENGYTLLDGDHEDTKFFQNGGQWLPENTENLRKAHRKILGKTKEMVDQGNKVVVDYIIFGLYRDFFEMFQEAFGDDLQIIVLFPSIEESVVRDKERECWTTGEERIQAVRGEFEEIKDILGKDKYIDTTGQTPEQTFRIIKRV